MQTAAALYRLCNRKNQIADVCEELTPLLQTEIPAVCHVYFTFADGSTTGRPDGNFPIVESIPLPDADALLPTHLVALFHEDPKPSQIRHLHEMAAILSDALMAMIKRQPEAPPVPYQSIFDNAGTGMVIVGKDRTIQRANSTFLRITGYPSEAMQGRMFWIDFIAPEDRNRLLTYHDERRKPGSHTPSRYVCRIIDAAGNRRVMNVRVAMIPGSGQSIASFNDITEQRTAEAHLRRREGQLKAMIDNFSGYVCVFNRSLVVEFMNQPAIRRVGYDGKGMPIAKVTPFPQLATDALRKEVFSGQILTKQIHDPHDGRWYEVVAAPIFGARGVVQLVQAMFTDITEQILEARALRERADTLKDENRRLRSGMGERYRFGDIIGKSAPMQALYDQILKAAASGENVIITGESGTGKELVAQAIHRMSSRKDKPFIVVNCGAVPDQILESEFFGYKKGAFTGADHDKPGYLDLAAGGTLFLDEIGELALSLQVKLLRVLEGGDYMPVGGSKVHSSDFRLVAATNRNLITRVREKKMREDFYYRIHIIPIHLPPLRERRDDIPLLVEHFAKAHQKQGNPAVPIPGRLMEAFCRHLWPGNIRELQNMIFRYLTLRHIDLAETDSRKTPAPSPESDKTLLKEAVQEFERQFIRDALRKNRWQKNRTAAQLGIHRKTLFMKLREYDIE